MKSEKNNICILVQELLPVYRDRCISDACKTIVDEHIKSCGDCQAQFNKMKADPAELEGGRKEELPSEMEEKQKFSAISKRLKHRRIRNVMITAGVVCILFAAYISCFRTMTVVSDSMSPTIQAQKSCVIFRYAYAFARPKRGDIIVANTGVGLDIARIAGVLGDVIEIIQGRLYVNGEANSFYHWITAPTESYSITVAQDTYFVLGDNFNNSYDSRYEEYGCIGVEDIYGKCIFHGDLWKNPFVRTSSTSAESSVD